MWEAVSSGGERVMLSFPKLGESEEKLGNLFDVFFFPQLRTGKSKLALDSE